MMIVHRECWCGAGETGLRSEGPHQEGRKGYRVGEAGQGAKEAHRGQEQPHRQDLSSSDRPKGRDMRVPERRV